MAFCFASQSLSLSLCILVYLCLNTSLAWSYICTSSVSLICLCHCLTYFSRGYSDLLLNTISPICRLLLSPPQSLPITLQMTAAVSQRCFRFLRRDRLMLPWTLRPWMTIPVVLLTNLCAHLAIQAFMLSWWWPLSLSTTRYSISISMSSLFLCVFLWIITYLIMSWLPSSVIYCICLYLITSGISIYAYHAVLVMAAQLVNNEVALIFDTWHLVFADLMLWSRVYFMYTVFNCQ